MQLKIDLHVHTVYSSDSLITPKDLIFYAKKRGLDGIAITDHDRIDGALKIARETDFLIVPGIEVSSLNGHIIGLNVNKLIPPRLSVSETLDRIHEAHGIAIACHPITFFKESLKGHISPRFDAIEVINSSAFPFNHSVRRSQEIASQLGIARVAGSDAHYGPEIGHAYTLVDSDSEVDDIVTAIRKGLCSPHGKAIPWSTRFKKELLFLRRKYFLRDKGEKVTESFPFGTG
ncbi:PHP domain-containing protein [Candidatus Bathyarchaeota archaeon]|nr:MAG: PHP domain-containing protein [Candidatus Bathyarchaeota archaeon]